MSQQNSQPLDVEAELQTDDNKLEKQRFRYTFKRLASIESTVSSSICLSVFNINAQFQAPKKYSLCNAEFLVKIVQLILGTVSIALYASGMHLMKGSEELMVFPSVIYGAFIIITTVIVLSYILGHLMPQIIIRIFLLLGVTLYFIAGCVAFYEWYQYGRNELVDRSSARMLLSDACLNIFNSVLYGCDLYLSIKASLAV